MSLISRLRRVRWLPRAALAVLALTTLQTALLPCAMAGRFDVVAGAMAGAAMFEHCAYCPDASHHGDNEGCKLSQSIAIDAPAAHTHQLVALLSAPLFQTFVVAGIRNAHAFPPESPLLFSPQRPLTLTYCVQLK